MKTKIPISILCVLLLAVQATAESIGAISGSIMFNVKNDTLNSYQNRAMYFDINKSQLYISGISSIATKAKKQNQGIWVWKFNTSTGTISEPEFTSLQNMAINISDIQSIQTTNTGNMLLVVATENGQRLLVNIDVNGGIKYIKKLTNEKFISKIIATTDSKLILLGRQSQKSLVMKINDSGVEEWSKVFERGLTESIVDGIATSNGGFILTENSAKYERLFIGESSLFLTKFDANGNKIDEKYLPGRYGYIAKGNDGSFAVIYDKKADSSQEIWVQAYDKDLSPLWSQKIIDSKFGLERFKIVGLASGTYVVAGSVNGKPWVTCLDSGGTKKWDYLSTSQDIENSVDIVANGNDAYLVSTVIRLNSDKALNNKIKLIKFQP